MTTTACPEPVRQPAGVPVGGQYATTVRSEPDVNLHQLAPEDGSHADEAIVELNSAELMAAARASIRTQAWRQNLRFEGEDDMVQETLAAVLLNKKNNGQVILTRPYVRVVAAAIVAQAARGRLRAEDRKAIGIFTRQVGELEAEMGRNLNGTERDQVASRIRDEWPDPRHRPSTDFVALAEVRVVSLDAGHSASGGVHDGDQTLGDVIADDSQFSASTDDDEMSVDADTPAGEVLSGVRANRAQNRSDAWELFRGVAGLPAATPGQVKPRVATVARIQIADGGGVAAAARTWTQGETSAATRALFAPFGGLDDTGRDAIAGALISHAAYAEELWNAALSASSKRDR